MEQQEISKWTKLTYRRLKRAVYEDMLGVEILGGGYTIELYFEEK